MNLLLVFLVLIVTTAASRATLNDHHVICSVFSKSGGHCSGSDDSKCLSWQLTVETYNLRDWKQVPEECISYIGDYMMGTQHAEDCTAAADVAFAYAQTVNLTGDGKDAWILTKLPFLFEIITPALQFSLGECCMKIQCLKSGLHQQTLWCLNCTMIDLNRFQDCFYFRDIRKPKRCKDC